MLKWTKAEKSIYLLVLLVSIFFAFPQNAFAMHIMEGYLPVVHCVSWGVICLPFLASGVFSIRRKIKDHPRTLILLAMSGAFIFVISSLKIPSVTGSCSHMTGTGLGAILIGPAATGILGLVVLIFQAILLAHGGLTSLGANTFSMAIAGPLFTFLFYQIGKKLKWNRKINVFIAAALGDLFTYCVTSVQLAMAYPSESGGFFASLGKFLAVFAPTQIPLAVIEGILTVLIIIGLESLAVSELKEIGYLKEGELK